MISVMMDIFVLLIQSLVGVGPAGEPSEQQQRQMRPSKRTFCNAFTGGYLSSK
jgi:hypothetical protein